jgi:hypothetical protein
VRGAVALDVDLVLHRDWDAVKNAERSARCEARRGRRRVAQRILAASLNERPAEALAGGVAAVSEIFERVSVALLLSLRSAVMIRGVRSRSTAECGAADGRGGGADSTGRPLVAPKEPPAEDAYCNPKLSIYQRAIPDCRCGTKGLRVFAQPVARGALTVFIWC